MKLGVDSRMMVGKWKHRGIGRYIVSLLKEFPINNIVGFIPKEQSIDTFDFVSKGFRFFPWWEQIVLPKIVVEEKVNYLLCPSITSPVRKIDNAKKIVVVYDLIFMQSFLDLPPSHSLYNNLGRVYRRIMAPKTYLSADILISISEYSKKELSIRFGIPSEKICVLPCSITNDWFVESIIPAEERQPYLLTVSGDAPSKNLPRLFLAFSKVVKEEDTKHFKLRIVGIKESSHSIFLNLASKLGISDNIILEKFVSNEDLQMLYRNAWASLTLSLYEGFGIPVVEAMASGTPVICSNTTSMPEVAGTSAYLVDPRNEEDIANHLLKMIKASPNERNKLGVEGFNHSKKFSEQVVSGQISDFWLNLSVEK